MSIPGEQIFQIGQIIYVLLKEKGTVIPAIINEEILHRTREGNFVSYKILFGSPKTQKQCDLAKLSPDLYDVYGSIEDMRNGLTNKLNEYIDNTCHEAYTKATTWYGTAGNQQPPLDKSDPQTLINEIETIAQQSALPQQSNNSFPIRSGQHNNNPTQILRTRMVDEPFEKNEVMLEDGSVKKLTFNTPKE